ncbi:UPF0171 family protein [Planoprotostelium fungivorum]|uniref:UPF0171 family protein n=1 Tax=Planoprotostelium fungivorum TaxID=1890364 RepID=A0A2P6N200_9EUKA|nr:UPF0171 family protein [Planoprotostelium fungivorum]
MLENGPLYKTVGLILVVNTSQVGDQLLFRYPSVIRSQVSQETLQAFAHNRNHEAKANKDNASDKQSNGQSARVVWAVTDGKTGTSTEVQQYEAYNLPSPTLAPQLLPKPALCNSFFQLTIDNTYFLGHPALLREREDSFLVNSLGKSRSDRDVLRMFNFCIVLAEEEGLPHDPAHSDMYTVGTINQYRHMVEQITVALEHEQYRCSYLEEQAKFMAHIREQWLVAQRDDRSDVLKPDHQALTSQLLSVSHLAREMREIYHMIREQGNLNIRFNGWVTVICSLDDPSEHSEFPIRPYHTLLLLTSTSKQRWSNILPPDSSPLLRKLIESAKPTKSFRELQIELDIPFAYLYRLAAHLVYWGRAKIIDTLTKNNIYTLNHNHNPLSYRLLSEEFSRTFSPGFRFEDMMERFSTSKTLGEHTDYIVTQSVHREFVDTVVWMLQKDLILQLHTFVYLRVPPPQTNPAQNPSQVARRQEEEGAMYPSSPIPLKPWELTHLEKFNDKGPLFQTLIRLCPYFRGRHHLEEIMFRMNISREDLNKVITKYQNVLICCTHEGTSQMISVVAAEHSTGYKTAHIVLMCIAFIILLPLAAFIAHFAKLYKKKWLPYHAILNTVAFVLVVIAFALGVVLGGNTYTLPGKNKTLRIIVAHAWIGTLATFFVVVQFILGIGAHAYHDHRAEKDPSKRGTPTIPGIIHRWLGRLTFSLAISNIALGMVFVKAATVWIVLFCVWGGVVVLLWTTLTALTWHKRGEKMKEKKTEMETAGFKPARQ